MWLKGLLRNPKTLTHGSHKSVGRRCIRWNFPGCFVVLKMFVVKIISLARGFQLCFIIIQYYWYAPREVSFSMYVNRSKVKFNLGQLGSELLHSVLCRPETRLTDKTWLTTCFFSLPLSCYPTLALSRAHGGSHSPSYHETACPLKLWSSWEKQRQLGPGDITSCVFEGPVVCLIWFRWKRSVWITVGYRFPVLAVHHFALRRTLLLTQASCGS